MTFDLLTGVTPFVIAFAVLAVAGVALALGLVTTSLVRNHAVRVRRHETIRHYYGHLALGH